MAAAREMLLRPLRGKSTVPVRGEAGQVGCGECVGGGVECPVAAVDRPVAGAVPLADEAAVVAVGFAGDAEAELGRGNGCVVRQRGGVEAHERRHDSVLAERKPAAGGEHGAGGVRGGGAAGRVAGGLIAEDLDVAVVGADAGADRDGRLARCDHERCLRRGRLARACTVASGDDDPQGRADVGGGDEVAVAARTGNVQTTRATPLPPVRRDRARTTPTTGGGG